MFTENAIEMLTKKQKAHGITLGKINLKQYKFLDNFTTIERFNQVWD